MRKNILILFFVAAATALSYNHAAAQGCVAIRSTGGFCTAGEQKHIDTASQWQLTENNRYYKSFKHYIGTTYQKQRQQLGNEVINHAYTNDIAIYRILNPRWSFMLDMPISANAS